MRLPKKIQPPKIFFRAGGNPAAPASLCCSDSDLLPPRSRYPRHGPGRANLPPPRGRPRAQICLPQIGGAPPFLFFFSAHYPAPPPGAPAPPPPPFSPPPGPHPPPE